MADTGKIVALINALAGSGVKALKEGKADVIAPVVDKTSIASFSDGADGIPLKACTVEVDASEAGRTGCMVRRSGKNLWDNALFGTYMTLITDTTSPAYGYYNGSVASWSQSEYGKVNFSGNGVGRVTVSLDGMSLSASSTFTFRLYFYYTDGTSGYIENKSVASQQNTHVTLTSVSGKSVVGFKISTSSGASNTYGCIKNVQLELGDTETAYEAPQTTAYPVSWQTEAGTVYDDAELDLIAGTLTVGEETYQLENLPTITTLKGQNNIWADCGDVSVKYAADTELYVAPDRNRVSVGSATPTITGESGKRYVCGTVTEISITPPATGIIDVVFTSGTTPAVLTIPNTVKFPGWFDPTSLDASTTYEINIQDGTLGAVMTWT